MNAAALATVRMTGLAYAAIGTIFYEEGIIQALRTARGADPLRPGETDIVSTATQAGLLAILAVLLLVGWRQVVPKLRQAWPILALLGLCFVSAAWSAHPLTTLRRAATLSGCMLFGLYLHARYGFGGTLEIVGNCALVLAVLSIAVFVAAPSIGRETAAGYETAMRGAFSQKNPMAECMLLGLLCLAYPVLRDGLRARHLAAALLFLACIALGRAATSLGLATLLLVAIALLRLGRRPAWQVAIGFFCAWCAAAVITLLVIAPDSVWRLVGRDASFTGRGPLWHEVLSLIARHPLTGAGYAGFWDVESADVQYVWLLTGWHAPDAHNGYLEIMLELGVAGLLAWCAVYLTILRRAVASWRRTSHPASLWPALFAGTVALLNLDESPLGFANGFNLVLPCVWLAVSPAQAVTSAASWRVPA